MKKAIVTLSLLVSCIPSVAYAETTYYAVASSGVTSGRFYPWRFL